MWLFFFLFVTTANTFVWRWPGRGHSSNLVLLNDEKESFVFSFAYSLICQALLITHKSDWAHCENEQQQKLENKTYKKRQKKDDHHHSLTHEKIVDFDGDLLFYSNFKITFNNANASAFNLFFSLSHQSHSFIFNQFIFFALASVIVWLMVFHHFYNKLSSVQTIQTIHDFGYMLFKTYKIWS